MGGEPKKSETILALYKFILPLFHEIPCILYYGTLLGYQRENNFIENDDDIDVIVDFKYKNKLWYYLMECQSNGIEINTTIPHMLQITKDGIGPFDIYFYTIENNHIQMDIDNFIKYDCNLIFPLKEVVWFDEKVYIPSNSEEVLRLTYGDMWRTPLKKSEYNWGSITLLPSVINFISSEFPENKLQ